MSKILSGQKINGETVSSDNPKKLVTGFATQVANEPLIEKTNKIAKIDQLLSKFQRCFSFSIKPMLLF